VDGLTTWGNKFGNETPCRAGGAPFGNERNPRGERRGWGRRRTLSEGGPRPTRAGGKWRAQTNDERGRSVAGTRGDVRAGIFGGGDVRPFQIRPTATGSFQHDILESWLGTLQHYCPP
jgi:hypothetical protein